MDSSRFDELTKVLATPTSRRQALKTLAATTLGGILGLSGIGNVFAKPCTPLGRHCNRKTVCCGGGSCDPTTSKCACPPGTTLLNGTCCPNANVCGTTCLAAPCDACSTCQNGTCVSSCGTTQACLANGTCATICPPSDCSCGNGSCQPDISGAHYCFSGSSPFNNGPCTSDSNCNRGYFCYYEGICIPAC